MSDPRQSKPLCCVILLCTPSLNRVPLHVLQAHNMSWIFISQEWFELVSSQASLVGYVLCVGIPIKICVKAHFLWWHSSWITPPVCVIWFIIRAEFCRRLVPCGRSDTSASLNLAHAVEHPLLIIDCVFISVNPSGLNWANLELTRPNWQRHGCSNAVITSRLDGNYTGTHGHGYIWKNLQHNKRVDCVRMNGTRRSCYCRSVISGSDIYQRHGKHCSSANSRAPDYEIIAALSGKGYLNGICWKHMLNTLKKGVI